MILLLPTETMLSNVFCVRDGVKFLRTRASLFAFFVYVQVVCSCSQSCQIYSYSSDGSSSSAAVWFELQSLLGGCTSATNATTFHNHNLSQFEMSTGPWGSGGGSGDTGSSPAVNPQVTGGTGASVGSAGMHRGTAAEGSEPADVRARPAGEHQQGYD